MMKQYFHKDRIQQHEKNPGIIKVKYVKSNDIFIIFIASATWSAFRAIGLINMWSITVRIENGWNKK